MSRQPKPYYRKAQDRWVCTIDGNRVTLGQDKKAAFEQFHIPHSSTCRSNDTNRRQPGRLRICTYNRCGANESRSVRVCSQATMVNTRVDAKVELWLDPWQWPESLSQKATSYTHRNREGSVTSYSGAIASRLEEPAIQASLKELGVCAVVLCSNRATETQVGFITKFAHQVADGRVLLFPDRDDEGTAGFKELLWQLAQTEVQVRVVPPETAAGPGKQPEDHSG